MADPKDPILQSICREMHKLRARIFQGCSLLAGFRSPAADKILWGWISVIIPHSAAKQSLQFFHEGFHNSRLILQPWQSQHSFLSLLVSSFLYWRQKVKKKKKQSICCWVSKAYTPPLPCIILHSASWFGLKHHRLLGLLCFRLLTRCLAL